MTPFRCVSRLIVNNIVTVNSNMPTPHPVKENVVVIKPAPVEKVKNNKKEKVRSSCDVNSSIEAKTKSFTAIDFLVELLIKS